MGINIFLTSLVVFIFCAIFVAGDKKKIPFWMQFIGDCSVFGMPIGLIIAIWF